MKVGEKIIVHDKGSVCLVSILEKSVDGAHLLCEMPSNKPKWIHINTHYIAHTTDPNTVISKQFIKWLREND